MNAIEAKRKTIIAKRSKDKNFTKHMAIFNKAIKEAVSKGDSKANIPIIDPSKESLTNLVELGYKVNTHHPIPQNDMVRELMMKNRGSHWGVTIEIEW